MAIHSIAPMPELDNIVSFPFASALAIDAARAVVAPQTSTTKTAVKIVQKLKYFLIIFFSLPLHNVRSRLIGDKFFDIFY